MGKRVKSKQNLIAVTSFSRADELLKRLGELQLQIEAEKVKVNDDINELKLEMIELNKPLAKEIERIVKSLDAFCTSNRDMFNGRQSRELGFGIIGWRKSTKISVKNTALEKVKGLFKRGAKKYLNITETVNKDALGKLPDETLAKLDAQRVRKEVFFAEPALPKDVGYTEWHGSYDTTLQCDIRDNSRDDC